MLLFQKTYIFRFEAPVNYRYIAWSNGVVLRCSLKLRKIHKKALNIEYFLSKIETLSEKWLYGRCFLVNFAKFF